MRGRWFMIFLIVAGILFYLSQRAQRAIGVGQPVPDFALPTATGEVLHLDALRGQVVLLNFWATFCRACAVEMPSLNRLAAHFAGRNFQIIGVSEDGLPQEAWPRIAAYQERIAIDFPVVLDASGAVADRFGTFMLPETYVIDVRGRLVRKVVGVITWDDPNMVAEIDGLLQSSARSF